MNKMAEVAKLFDKELEEKFTIINDKDVAICDACFNEEGVNCFPPAVSAIVLKRLLTGTYRIKGLPWKAEETERYYVYQRSL